VLGTSFQVPWTQKNVHFSSKSKNFGKPEVVCFSRTVSDRNVVPSPLQSERGPLSWKSKNSRKPEVVCFSAVCGRISMRIDAFDSSRRRSPHVRRSATPITLSVKEF
jgi:hypothetical protein